MIDSTQPSKKVTLHWINILKAFLCFCVVAAHTTAKEVNSTLWYHVIFAPTTNVFFIISGFFLVRNGGDTHIDIASIKRQTKKIFWLIVSSNLFYIIVFYLPIDIYHIFVVGEEVYLKRFSVDNVFHFLIMGGYVCGPLWYLNAYLFALLFVWGFEKIRLTRLALIASLTLLAIAPIDSVTKLNILPINSNALWIAFPHVVLGMAIKMSLPKLLQNLLIVKVLSVVVYLMVALLMLYVPSDIYSKAVMPVFSLCMFMFAMAFGQNWKDGILNKIGGKHSLNIYIYHSLIIWTIMFVLNKIVPQEIINFPFVATVITFILTLLFSIYLEKCKNKYSLLKKVM